MKTLLLAIEKRTLNSALQKECDFIKFLNFNALYADEVRVIDVCAQKAFERAFSQKWDLIFVLNSQDAEFNIAEFFNRTGLSFDGDGFCLKVGIVSLVPKEINARYAEGLKAALSQKYGFYAESLTFKLYGADFNAVKAFCEKLNSADKYCHFLADDIDGDIKVVLTYGENAPKSKVDGAIREFIKTFKNHIYAEDDISLEERLNQVLRLRNLKLCTAESMTGGLIAAKIVSISGASDIFYEGLTTYDTLAKERRLGVNHATVVKNTVVSAPIAYEMAAGLLDGGNCSVAITITGYAGSDVHPDKDDGLCFIGIGVRDIIKVFEYRFQKTRKENIQSAANAAIFLAIKTVEELDGFNPYD